MPLPLDKISELPIMENRKEVFSVSSFHDLLQKKDKGQINNKLRQRNNPPPHFAVIGGFSF